MGKNILIHKTACLLIFILLSIQYAFSQKRLHISGTITLDDKPLSSAIVKLYKYETDSLVAFTISGTNGFFNLAGMYFISNYKIKISHVSINDTVINIHTSLLDTLIWNETISLSRRSKTLEEIIIKGPALSFKINGDTISYAAEKYQANDVHKLEDLLKKMEGFHVDDDGRISFNGKQVSKILIEGDDLTGSRYKVLSKNIQSDLVSTVQVIQHFNDNWLLKGMENENGVGINIKIKPDKKNKINGHADFQYGNSGKNNIGLDLVSLNNKSKALFFLNKNNIGNDVAEDILYHWNGEEDDSHGKPNNQLFKSPLKIFEFPRPGLKRMYIDKNNDLSITAIESIKAGKHALIRILGTYKKEHQYYEGNFYRKFYFPGEFVWELNYKDYSSGKGNYFGNKYVLRIDNKRNRIAEYGVSFSTQKNQASFNEYRSGFEVDTLSEVLGQLNREFMVECNETFKLNGNAVIRVENTTALPIKVANLFFQSDRLPQNLRSLNSRDYQQYLKQQIFSSNTDVSLNIPSVKISKVFGVHADAEKIHSSAMFTNYVNQIGIPILNNGLMVHSTKNYLYGRFMYKFNKKINLNAQVGLGIGNIHVLGIEKNSAGIYAFKLSTNYAKTAFKQLGLSFHLAKKPPFTADFFPSPLVGGNSTLLYGMQHPSFPLSRRVELNFLRNDLYIGLLLSGSLTAEMLSSDNSIAVKTLPRYVVTSFFTSPISKNISTNASVEKNIHHLNLKTSIAANFTYLESTSKVNDVLVNSEFYIRTFYFNVISKWQRNYNFEFSSALSTSSIYNQTTSFSNRIGSIKYSVKSTYQANKKLNGSFIVAVLKNQNQPIFHSFDGIWQYKVNKQIGVNLTLHNLFNQQVFYEKQYGIYSYSESNINLIGRIILFGVQWNF